MLARALTLALVVSAAGVAAEARAQVSPDVAEAHRAALAGNFDAATGALDAALARSNLSREDLLTIYEAKVFVDFANGATDRMGENLERIAALDPNHAFDPNFFPADVTNVFRAIVNERGAPLTVEADAVVLASGEFEVRAEVDNDPGLSRDVRVYGRGGAGQWETGSRSVRVAAEGADTGLYYAEAIGPGGAVLARDGQPLSPRTVDLSGAPEEGGGGVPMWVWIAGGAVLAAIVVTIIAVAVSSSGVSDNTQPTGPMVRFSGM